MANDLTLKMVLDLKVGQALAALNSYTSGLAETKAAAQDAATSQSKSYEQIRANALAAFGRTKEAAEQSKAALEAAQQTAQQLAREWKASQAAAAEYKGALDKAAQSLSGLKGELAQGQSAQAAARQEVQAASAALKESQSRLSALQKEYASAGADVEQLGLKLSLANKEVAGLAQAETSAKEKLAATSAAVEQQSQALAGATAAQRQAAEGSRAATAETARLKSAFDGARQGVRDADAAYLQSNASLNQLRSGLRGAADAQQQHEEVTRQNSTGLLGLIGRLQSFKAEVEASKQATLSAAAGTGQHTAAVIKNAAALGEGSSGMASMLGRASALASSVPGVGWALAAVTAVLGAQLGKLVEVNVAYDKVNRTLVTVTGSQQKAAAEMDFVRGLTDRLGLSVVDAANSYAKLAASSMGTQLEGKKTRDIFESVSTAASRLGLSTEESNGALLAISQMMSKGTVQAEELRGQLGERLPGAFQIAARSMGVSTAELGKMLETGQVMSEEFLPRFAAELQKSFATGKQETGSFAQEWTRLKSSFENALVLLGKAGVMDALASGVRMASAAVGVLSDGIEFISPQIKFLFSGIQIILEGIRAGFLTLKITIEAFGVAFNTVLALVFMGLSRITTGKLSDEFRQLSVDSEKAAERLRGGINKDLDGLKDAFDKASRGSVDMVAKLAGFNAEANAAGKAAKAAAEKINASWMELGGSIRMASDAIDKSLKGVTERLSKLKEEISANLGKLDTLFRADLAAMEGSVAATKALNTAKDANDEATHQARLHRLEEFWVTEKQRLAQSTTENLKYHKTKLAEEVAAGTQQLATIDTLYAGQIERLKKLKQDSTKLEEEMRAKKLAVLKEMESAVRTHVDALNAELQRHRDKFVALEEEKRQLAQTTEDRLRGLQQVGMNDYEKYLDDQKQADLDMARAKEAARTGDYSAAKQWADKAAQLALQNAHEISDGEQVVITAREAAAAATRRVQDAATLAKSAIEAEQAANSAAAGRIEAERNRELAQLQQVQQAIAGIAQQSAQALELHIKAEATQVKTLMADLDKEITERDRLLPIKLKLEDAEEQFRIFAEKIKAGQEVNVDTTKARAALKALGDYAKDYPLENTLKLDNDAALKKIADVEGKVKALDKITTESQHSVQLEGPNGLTAALQKIRSLNNENTSSTHTINVVRVEQNASGGLAGAGLLASALAMPMAAFATGGPVGFADVSPAPLHQAGTVPGVGDGDTYRADLPAGSFVIKKAATQFYGTGLLEKLAHFATGGLADRIDAGGYGQPLEPAFGTNPTPTTTTAPTTTKGGYDPAGAAKRYQVTGTDYPTVEGLRSFSPLLSVGQKIRHALTNAIAAGNVTAADVSNVAMSRDNYWDGKHYGWTWNPMARSIGPGGVPVFGSWVRSNEALPISISRTGPARALLGDVQKKLLNPPIGWASDLMLRTAVLGSVLGKVPDSASQLEGLVRQAMNASDSFGSNYASAGLPGTTGGPGSKLSPFAAGGHARGTDIVPAMLTPGEFVVRRDVVAKLGVGVMNALNSMSLGKRAAAMLANATAPVLHFATGGLVPGGNPSNAGNASPAPAEAVRVVEIRFVGAGTTARGQFSEHDATALVSLLKQAKGVSVAGG